jgi:transcriptional regulator with XRE-family HTH domain
MLTASQCRAARGLLNWTQQELADAARIGVATVRLFESEATETRPATLVVVRQAFELAGVEFTNGDQPGVRLTKGAATHSGQRKAMRGKTKPAEKK